MVTWLLFFYGYSSVMTENSPIPACVRRSAMDSATKRISWPLMAGKRMICSIGLALMLENSPSVMNFPSIYNW